MAQQSPKPETCSTTPPATLASPLDNTIKRLKAGADQRANDGEEAYKSRQVAIARERLERSLGKRYSQGACSLAAYRVYDPRQQIAVDTVNRVLGRLAEVIDNGEGVLLVGSVGTGKDHFLGCLLYAALDAKCEVKYVNGQEVFGTFRDRIDTGERDEEYFRELTMPGLLAVSDPLPPVGQPGAWDLQNLYRIVDRRYREKRPTWMTMNALSPEDMNAQLSSQVFDRLRHDATIIPCFWPSFRERR